MNHVDDLPAGVARRLAAPGRRGSEHRAPLVGCAAVMRN